MKTFFTLLTKISKIKHILIYVYRGLVVGKAAFVAGFDALKEEKPDDPSYSKFENIPDYLETAAKAIKTILMWIGVDTADVDVLASREGELIAAGGKRKVLEDITVELKNI